MTPDVAEALEDALLSLLTHLTENQDDQRRRGAAVVKLALAAAQVPDVEAFHDALVDVFAAYEAAKAEGRVDLW